MEQLLRDLVERRAALEAGVFSHPPDDWAAFQCRFGRWQELSFLIDEITGKVEDKEKEL